MVRVDFAWQRGHDPPQAQEALRWSRFWVSGANRCATAGVLAKDPWLDRTPALSALCKAALVAIPFTLRIAQGSPQPGIHRGVLSKPSDQDRPG